MFCPYCGRKFEGDKVRNCPYCGQSLNFHDGIVDSIRSRPKALSLALLLVVGIIAIGSLFVILNDGSRGNSESAISMDVGQGETIVLSGDFVTGELVTYMVSGDMVIYLDIDNDDFSTYRWMLHDYIRNTDRKAVKMEPEVRWTTPEIGAYLITLDCYAGPKDIYPTVTFAGNFWYYGTSTIDIEWDYRGETVEVPVSITTESLFDSYYYRTPSLIERYGIVTADSQKFVDPASVSSLQSELRSVYDGIAEYSDYGYADFLLSFVEQSFLNVPDSLIRGCNQYRAYPVETLFVGAGDSEDKSILYISLLKAAGMDAGLLYLPGVCTSLVDAEAEVPDTVPAGYRFRIAEVEERLYLVADVTSEQSLGLLDNRCDFDIASSYYAFDGKRYTGEFGPVLV